MLSLSVADLDPNIRIRLEVPQRRENNRNEYVDLLCETDDAHSLIEFKYATRRWDGEDPQTGEQFHLRSHAAMDLARFHFIHDVYRLEQWTSERDHTNGFAVLLTNAASLWQPGPRSGTRDAAYRLDQGRTLTGNLIWGTPDHPAARNSRHLNGTYIADWHNYTDRPLPGGQPGSRLRWLGWTINGRWTARTRTRCRAVRIRPALRDAARKRSTEPSAASIRESPPPICAACLPKPRTRA